jgi:tetratricopeptide (TPR) repeat protein
MKEADFAEKQNRFVEAQSLLVKLADDFGKHAYAPFALYQAARNAERRGQDTFYRDANRLIERLIRDYPKSDLVFYARLKQGDLLRKLNEFPLAQQAYEELANAFPKHPDILFAQLARAACHAAQAGIGQDASGQHSGHVELALGIYERLVDQADAPVDIRIEAGYNLGLLLSRRGKSEGKKRAESVWWQQVLTPFVLDDEPAKQLSARGRYWASRTLLAIAESFETQSRLDQAREAYILLINRGLPGQAIAKSSLARLGSLK